MTKEEKWAYLVELDERLLLGGVLLSEWATFLVKDADLAFVGGAHLASIITGLAGVETHLRGETGMQQWPFGAPSTRIHGSDTSSDLGLLALNEELGRKEGMAIQYSNLGLVYQTRGELGRAVEVWKVARNLYAEIGVSNRVEQLEEWLSGIGDEQQ